MWNKVLSEHAEPNPTFLVRHHHGDGGLRVVNVEGAAIGDKFHQPGGAVVVADMGRRDGGNDEVQTRQTGRNSKAIWCCH